MHIKIETKEQINERLMRVMAQAELKVYDGTYAFEEFLMWDFPSKVRSEALALIRDNESWSQLVPSQDNQKELFKVLRFRFKEGLDNSGFIGWLAFQLKLKLGTGVFVICGQNSKYGGIFDYWGFPAEIAGNVISEIKTLIIKGKLL